MERISQPNARILLGLSGDLKLKYIYDGYTFACDYKAIRKKKTRAKVRKAFHEAGISKERAQEEVGKLVQFDELLNAKTYKELEKYLKDMFDGVPYTYSILSDMIYSIRACKDLEPKLYNFYRYRTENY